MKWQDRIKLILALAVVVFCFLEFLLQRHISIFREWEAAFLSLQSLVVGCLVLWYAGFLWLNFRLTDDLMIRLLALGLVWLVLGGTKSSTQALFLFFGVMLGKGMFLCFESGKRKAESRNYLVGLVALLTLAAWWRLDMSDNYYHGPRWMGLWENPNTYGMLMGAGVALAIGLLAANSKFKIQNSKTNWFLGIAVFMLGVGLVMSYSRGAWLGAAMGLLYLAWAYGKLKWRYVILGAGVLALGSWLIWGNTLDSAPWYVKRADLGRLSAQNRATAWRAGLEIMRDHPLGVGWNNAVKIYGEKYSPPEGGPGALTTNDYMMLGTELGIPALLCFMTYVALCYRKSPRPHLTLMTFPQTIASTSKPSTGLRPTSLAPASEGHPFGSGEGINMTQHESLRAACLAGASVFAVAFWFDGGLFNLPTAAVFWVLLELGAARGGKIDSRELS